MKFYVCEHCGNIVTKLTSAGVPLVCCGEEMKLLEAGVTDAAVEKHVPAVTVDGNLVKVGNWSHSVHCFLHADYGISREELEQELGKDGCFAGYHSIGRVDWSDTIRVGGPRGLLDDVAPYCFMEIFERNMDKDESWGAKRIAVTFLYADGIQTYKQLFVKQYKKAPWLFLLQDHGFGGNYDRFGRGGMLDRIIQKEEAEMINKIFEFTDKEAKR